MGVLDMLNPGLVLKIRLICYLVLIVFSFFIFVGVAVMKSDTVHHMDNCPLYCDYSTGRGVDCGGESNCNYPMAISIIFQLIFLTFRIASLLLLMLGKMQPDSFLFSDPLEFVYVVVDLLAFFLTFIGACILSAGTNYTKDELDRIYGYDDDWESPSEAAQAGAWISTFVWLFVGVVGFLYMMRSGKIPCLAGGATSTGGQQGGGGGAPPTTNQEPPPYNPDDVKY